MSTASDDPRDDGPQLPELADDRIEKIEGALFATIAKERSAHRTRRTRIWIASAAAAVVIVVAAAIAPTMSTLVSGGASTTRPVPRRPAPRCRTAGATSA